MEVAVTTDVGSGQRFNDDAWCHEQLHRNVTLLAVADGFGRLQGVPSATVVLDAVREIVRRELRRATFPSKRLTAADIRELLTSAFAHGNERLLDLGGGNADFVAAGSTCTLVLIVDNQAFIAHVGDSRAYLLRRGELVQLTTDESLLPELVRSGAMTGDVQSKHMPALLMRALGVEPAAAVPPKIAHYTLHPHDSLMLCTDGVSRSVGFAETQGAMASRETVQAAAERIVALARNSGSIDNATVLLARNATVHGAPGDVAPRITLLPSRLIAVAIAVVVLLVTAGAIVREFFFDDWNLYLAADPSGHVGMFAGSPDTFFGVPLHVERTSFELAVSKLAPQDRRQMAAGAIPVANADAANALAAQWQARSKP
jgi:PPM family protein phosphatase